MDTYRIIDLFISGLGALGTCGATILALYFWFRDEALKLRFSGMHGYAYGSFPSIEGGYLALRFTNTGYKPISLELAGLKFTSGYFYSKKNTIIEFSMQNNNLINDPLPKMLQHGEIYMYVVPWNSFLELCDTNEFRKISIYVYISSLQKEISFNFSKNILSEINSRNLLRAQP